MQVGFLGREDPLEKEMATYSSILVWEIQGTRSLVGCSLWGCKESSADRILLPHSALPIRGKQTSKQSESEATQSCPSLRDPVDCSPQGSSVHGIFQERILE